MKTFVDCIPCLVRQALDSVRLVTDDEAVHKELLRTVLRAISDMDLRQSPPTMGQRIHRLIRTLTGQRDPYREMKTAHNHLALQIYPTLKTRVEQSEHPLQTAIRLAIAGNVIDMAVNSRLSERHVRDGIDRALTLPFEGNVQEFSRAISKAERILYLADNAGEIVLDRLLIEQMPMKKLTVVVRGSPVINDATMIDAETAGITELVETIDNGSDAPGTLLDDCSEAFRERFNSVDVIIAKGNGNYETLSEVDRDIFFALKVKCSVIARDLGCPVDTLVLQRSAQRPGASRRKRRSSI
jgi:uncharacterized protein with ATP-grasp and redox domains